VKLRGMAWDHRRCWGPLEASLATYCATRPGLEIEWERRSLYDFGEGALDSILSSYDLVIFDHPHTGDIARGQWMVPFDDFLTAEQMDNLARDSVGPSWRSYACDGRQWALPIDAACQVASYRPDLLDRYGPVPRSLDEVLALGRAVRKNGKWLGLPLIPTDAMSLFLTLTNPQAEGTAVFDPDVVAQAIALMRQLAALSHPDSPRWNPIRCYEHMIANDDVVYVPFAFGYVNYASRRDGPHLLFADAPTENAAGSLLGGAGIGVSARSRHRQAAIDYAVFLCAPDYQRGGYVTAGGQPGSLAAWQDDAANALCRDFFRRTLRTLQAAYLRPTHPGFVRFFREASRHVATAIDGGAAASELADTLNRTHHDADLDAAASRSGS
jgi:multiple sugar transport system substrate-binding protein